MPGLDSIYREHASHWPGIYAAVRNILGRDASGNQEQSGYTILNFGDQLRAGKVNASTFEAMGALDSDAGVPSDLTWTWSEDPFGFGTPFDLTLPDNFLGHLPIATFNGTDEEADTPDDGFFTRDDSAGQGFSLGLWVFVTNTAAARVLLAKYDRSVAIQEWQWRVNTDDTVTLLLRDDSAGVEASRATDAAVPMGAWTFLVVTYDGGGGATAADGIALYVNGSAVASTATNNGSYVGMENGTSGVQFGHTLSAGPAAQDLFNGKALGGPCGPFWAHKELSAVEVQELYFIGKEAAGLG